MRAFHWVITVVLFCAACSDDGGGQPPTPDTQPPAKDGGLDVATPDGQAPAPDGTAPQPDGTVLAGDCTDPGKTCFAPFVCRLNPKTNKKSCLSPVGDVPPCVGTPSGQVVPFATVYGSSLVVHWPMQPGCVATSYVPALKPRAAEIAAAVKGWHDVGCSALCLNPPTETAVPPDLARGERRIHFKLDTVTGMNSPALTQATYESDTGRIYTVEVFIDPQQQASVGAADLAQLLGFAVGLMQAPASASSVMKPSPTLTAPGSDDTAAFCKLYAQPGYCGD